VSEPRPEIPTDIKIQRRWQFSPLRSLCRVLGLRDLGGGRCRRSNAFMIATGIEKDAASADAKTLEGMRKRVAELVLSPIRGSGGELLGPRERQVQQPSRANMRQRRGGRFTLSSRVAMMPASSTWVVEFKIVLHLRERPADTRRWLIHRPLDHA